MSASHLATELAVSQRRLEDVKACRNWLGERADLRFIGADLFHAIIDQAREIRASMNRELEAFGVSAPADIAWEG